MTTRKTIPIRSRRFPNNWTLAAARSIAMLELLEKKFGINRANMAVAGYADTVPIADNKTAEGRAKNRRVDIIILNQFGLTSEPEKIKEAQRKAQAKSADGEADPPGPAKAAARSKARAPAGGPVKVAKAR